MSPAPATPPTAVQHAWDIQQKADRISALSSAIDLAIEDIGGIEDKVLRHQIDMIGTLNRIVEDVAADVIKIAEAIEVASKASIVGDVA